MDKNNMKRVVSLRKTLSEDIPALIEIERSASSRIYSATTTEREWQDEMAKENTAFYTILLENKIIGDVSYEIKDKDTAYISGLCIDSQFRGQGIGKEVMLIILEELKDKKRIELATHPDNLKAIKLYSSLGFEIKSRIENYFGDGEPRILMVKENK